MAGKKIDNEWYKKWFGAKEYLELYSHRNSKDAAKIAGLIFRTLKLPKGSKVLDAACGNGRHSFFFASKGYYVTGIDLSEFLINEAKKKLKGEYKNQAEKLNFLIRDIRNIGISQKFDLAVNLFSSFGYFEKDSENFKSVKSIVQSLKKGGYFFFDYLNPDYLKKNLIPFDISKRNRKLIFQVRELRENAVYKKIIIVKNSSRSYPRQYEFNEMIKLYSLNDFKTVFSKYGLKIIKIYGNYSGGKYNSNNSERMIILSKKF